MIHSQFAIKKAITKTPTSLKIATKDYTYYKQNRLMEIVKHDLTGNVEEKQKFVYDNNGNQLYFKIELTERATEDAKPSFGMFISGESYSGESAKKFFESNSVNTYNVFNQLIKTTVGDVEVRHKYDPEGKRIEKVTVKAGKSKTIKYLRLGNEIAMEVDEKGDVISRNVNGTAPISRETDGNKYFLLYNGEGDVTALVDRTGRVAERYEYDAFGNVTKSVDGSGKSLGMGESKNPVRYRGYEYDEETKLYYLNARMYDPSIARFIQEDTYRGNLKDPLSLNLYTYCHNNPIYYNDPTGHAASKPTMITAGDGGGSKKPQQTSQKSTAPKSAPKPTLEQKVLTGKYTKEDIGNMKDKELLMALSQIENRYSAASNGVKAYYNNMSSLLKAELKEQNIGNKMVSYYVALGDVKDAKAEISKNTFVPLDAKVLLSYVDKNGDLGNKNVISATTSSTTNANTKKEVIQVVDNKIYLQSPVNGKLFKASYNDKTDQMNPNDWNGFLLAPQMTLKAAMEPDKPGDSNQKKFGKTAALLSIVMITGSAGDTAFESNLDYQKMVAQNTASILGKTARTADALEGGVGTSRLIPGEVGVVTGGNSTTLGKNIMESMGLSRNAKWTGYQAQHIIPAQMADNPILQKIGMNLDDASNGIFLRVPGNDLSTMSRHQGFHSVYNDVVQKQLNSMDINQSIDVLQNQVYELQSNLRYLQEQGLPLYKGQGATVEMWIKALDKLN